MSPGQGAQQASGAALLASKLLSSCQLLLACKPLASKLLTLQRCACTNTGSLLLQTTNNETSDFWQVVPTGPLTQTGNRPGREDIEKSKADTMSALSSLVEAKQRKANPKSLPAGAVQPAPSYIKYTPAQQSKHFNSGAEHRIIQMQDMPVDPLEPPKFRHQKVPRVPDTTPVPVLHSPPRALTREDQDNWKIPPAVSGWKNINVRP